MACYAYNWLFGGFRRSGIILLLVLSSMLLVSCDSKQQRADVEYQTIAAGVKVVELQLEGHTRPVCLRFRRLGQAPQTWMVVDPGKKCSIRIVLVEDVEGMCAVYLNDDGHTTTKRIFHIPEAKPGVNRTTVISFGPSELKLREGEYEEIIAVKWIKGTDPSGTSKIIESFAIEIGYSK
ncbi:MAG: hypothetical protein K8S55_15520 [Phycisphaerae bacterium]|nr:hypothetical protein [Phycisphaerae bacterium]